MTPDATAAPAARNDWHGRPQPGFARQDPGAGAHLRHAELFPLDRPETADGRVAGLWIAAYFRGFASEHQGPHLFSVIDTGPDAANEVIAVCYRDVTGPGLAMRLDLDPLARSGPHTLRLAIDGLPLGEMSVTI